MVYYVILSTDNTVIHENSRLRCIMHNYDVLTVWQNAITSLIKLLRHVFYAEIIATEDFHSIALRMHVNTTFYQQFRHVFTLLNKRTRAHILLYGCYKAIMYFSLI